MWTKEEFDIAVDLKKRGFSAREIGAKLGKTKCSVLGKIYRNNKSHGVKGKTKASTNAKLPPKPELGGMPWKGCKWHTDGIGWCGKRVKSDKPYCSKHHGQSILRPQPKLDIDSLLKLAKRC